MVAIRRSGFKPTYNKVIGATDFLAVMRQSLLWLSQRLANMMQLLQRMQNIILLGLYGLIFTNIKSA